MMKTKGSMIFMLALLFVGCQREVENGDSADTGDDTIVKVTAAQEAAAGIQTSKVQAQTIDRTLQLNGVIDVPPQNTFVISPVIGGFVKTANVREGMTVRKGELLVSLENMEYIQLQQDYLEQKSKLVFLSAELERQEELSRENVNSGKNLQLARSNFEGAKAIVNALEEKLRLLNLSPERVSEGKIVSTIGLYAPVTGIVSNVNLSIGQFFGSAEPMLRVLDLRHVHVRLQAYERDVPSIREGQRVSFVLPGSTKTYDAVVYLVGKEILDDRTVSVHCHLSGDVPTLVPGMYVTAQVVIDSFSADVLPQRAVVAFGDSHVIFIASRETGKYQMVDVKTGESTREVVEVRFPDNFDRESEIVINGASELLGVIRNTGDDD